MKTIHSTILGKIEKAGCDMMAHDCSPGAWEVEAGAMQVSGQPGIHSEDLSQKKKNQENRFLYLIDSS